MFSPKFMNYIIDPGCKEKTSASKFPIQINEQVTTEVDMLKNDTVNFILNLKFILKGLKNKICHKNKA